MLAQPLTKRSPFGLFGPSSCFSIANHISPHEVIDFATPPILAIISESRERSVNVVTVSLLGGASVSIRFRNQFSKFPPKWLILILASGLTSQTDFDRTTIAKSTISCSFWATKSGSRRPSNTSLQTMAHSLNRRSNTLLLLITSINELNLYPLLTGTSGICRNSHKKVFARFFLLLLRINVNSYFKSPQLFPIAKPTVHRIPLISFGSITFSIIFFISSTTFSAFSFFIS